jgi:hypothetical protein
MYLQALCNTAQCISHIIGKVQRLDHEKAGKISRPPDKNEVNEAAKVFRLGELAARAEGRPKRPRCTARR